jgi:7-cyano-7-deazaguanine synthase
VSILVLFSGGLDSTVALFAGLRDAMRTNSLVYAIGFHYDQRHYKELYAAGAIASRVKVPFRVCQMPTWVFPDRSSSLLNGDVRKYDDPPSHNEAMEDPAFIPHRNLLFITIAAGFARHWQCSKIYTGLRGGFPDCTANFEMQVGDVLETSDPDFPIGVWSPCHGSREETIGLAYSLPGCWDALAYSMTCFEGTEPPCGHCLPCLKRAEGFAKFGKPDPLLVRLAKEGRYSGPIA